MYAILNHENICTMMSCKKMGQKCVEVNKDVLGKKYVDGRWEVTGTLTGTLTEAAEIALDTALNVEYMVCLMEETLGLE